MRRLFSLLLAIFLSSLLVSQTFSRSRSLTSLYFKFKDCPACDVHTGNVYNPLDTGCIPQELHDILSDTAYQVSKVRKFFDFRSCTNDTILGVPDTLSKWYRVIHGELDSTTMALFAQELAACTSWVSATEYEWLSTAKAGFALGDPYYDSLHHRNNFELLRLDSALQLTQGAIPDSFIVIGIMEETWRQPFQVGHVDLWENVYVNPGEDLHGDSVLEPWPDDGDSGDFDSCDNDSVNGGPKVYQAAG